MNHTQHCIQDISSCPPLRCRDLREARDFLTILLPHSQGILDTRWRSGKILGHQLSHTFHTDTRRTSRKGSSASGGIGRTWKKGTEKGEDEFYLSPWCMGITDLQWGSVILIDLNKKYLNSNFISFSDLCLRPENHSVPVFCGSDTVEWRIIIVGNEYPALSMDVLWNHPL